MITPTELLQNPWVAALAGGVSLTTVKFIADTMISSLDAPTKDSSPKYRYWFKVLNRFAANWARAANSNVESSPNFQGAVDIQTKQAGVAPITVTPVAPENAIPKP